MPSQTNYTYLDGLLAGEITASDIVDGSITQKKIALPPSVIYVNDATGNDSNNGSITAPIKTIAGLVSMLACGVVAREVVVKIFPHAGSGYLFSDLAKITGYQGRLTLEGQGGTGLTSTLTVASVSGRVIDFGSPALASRVYVGAHLTCLSGANTGISRTILSNDADEIETPAYPFAVSPGDTFRVQRPAVNITVDREATVRGGAAGHQDSSDGFDLTLINLSLFQTLEFVGATFSGQVNFFGVVLIGDDFDNFARFSHGRFFSGRTTYVDKYDTPDLNYPDTHIAGWGLSAWRSGSARRSFVQFFHSVLEIGGFSAETTQMHHCNAMIRDSEFESSGVDPHGALVSLNSYFNVEGGIIIDTTGSAYASVLVEGGQFEIFGSLVQRGDTAPCIVRYPGAIVFNNAAPTLTGQVQAINGGKVRLVNVDGSSVSGGYSVGYSSEIAASFAVAGDFIASSDDSSVYRSS